ncbi:hypothetical protein E5K00_21260 [Hymenobacter aquaticus]|uniref:Uncharacterized protein n=1 Tax=Hymenobacter aquaticus TaxID=1867101 RepID=A0A4Z0PSS6_9BACT|nr:hypothetical protein [Hymenobacter aquaticus]TGE20525.1 hypothetical protein E5K00_21260 [Hymenobacter aquaticus]
MKAVFLLVLAAILTSLQAEAHVSSATLLTASSGAVSATTDASADWGLFKRKKYKYKKRRKGMQNRRQHRTFGR